MLSRTVTMFGADIPRTAMTAVLGLTLIFGSMEHPGARAVATAAEPAAKAGAPSAATLPRAEDVLPLHETQPGSLVVTGDGFRFQIPPEFTRVAHPRSTEAYRGRVNGIVVSAELTLYATREPFPGDLEAFVKHTVERAIAQGGLVSESQPFKILIAGVPSPAHRLCVERGGTLDFHVLAVHGGQAFVFHGESPKLDWINLKFDLLRLGQGWHVAPPPATAMPVTCPSTLQAPTAATHVLEHQASHGTYRVPLPPTFVPSPPKVMDIPDDEGKTTTLTIYQAAWNPRSTTAMPAVVLVHMVITTPPPPSLQGKSTQKILREKLRDHVTGNPGLVYFNTRFVPVGENIGIAATYSLPPKGNIKTSVAKACLLRFGNDIVTLEVVGASPLRPAVPEEVFADPTGNAFLTGFAYIPR